MKTDRIIIIIMFNIVINITSSSSSSSSSMFLLGPADSFPAWGAAAAKRRPLASVTETFYYDGGSFIDEQNLTSLMFLCLSVSSVENSMCYSTSKAATADAFPAWGGGRGRQAESPGLIRSVFIISNRKNSN